MSDEDVTSDVVVDIDTGIQDQSLDEEGRARQYGWRPKEEWRGHPDKWLPADAFNEKGEQISRLLSVKTKRQEELLARQAAKLEELNATLSDFKIHHERTISQERKAHKAQLEAAKAEKDHADQQGDFDAYKSAESKVRELEASPPPDEKHAPQTPNHEITAFISRNAWFTTSPEMNASAVAFSTALEKKSPSLSLTENLTKTEEGIKRMYPEKFGNPRRSQEQAVESGSIPSSGGVNKPGYSSLPGDAKSACDRFVKNGLMTQKQYVDEYFKHEQKGLT